MKLIKVILSILLAFVILWVIVAFFSPKSISVTESIVIEQSSSIVFNQVNDFKNWTNWADWNKRDSLMTFSYSPITKGVGASIAWESEKEGNGSQKIIESKAFESIRMLLLIDDWDENYCHWDFVEIQEFETEVSWTFEDSQIDFLLRPLSFSINNSIRNDFKEGLQNLKHYCETEIQQNKKLKPKLEQIDAIYYIAKHVKCDFDNIGQEMGKSFGELMTLCSEYNWEIEGMPFSINYDTEEGQFEFDVAFRLKSEVVAPPGYISGIIPAGDMATISHFGTYENLAISYKILDKWIGDNGYKQNGRSFEFYITDPGMEPDSTKWETQIYYPVIKSEIP